MRTINANEMNKSELRSICGQLQTAINWRLNTMTIEMNDGTKVHFIDLEDQIQYYRSKLETCHGSIVNTGTKLNKINQK